MNNIKLSVIVCTYNRAVLLSSCLKSLTEQTLDPDVFEVIVVNNNSIDNSMEVAEQYVINFPFFRVVNECNPGHSSARNRGWQEACGKYVAFIDDDAKASPDWCERILNVFDNVKPVPAAVGGQIHPFYETSPPAWFSDEFEIRTWGESAGFLEPPDAKYGFSGSNMAFQRSVLEQFGGFSLRYGLVDGQLCMGEDTEFFNRIYEQEQYFWYDPLIKVYHWVPEKNFRVLYRVRRSFNCGQSLACMQGGTISTIDYAKCLAGIILCLLKALRKMFEPGAYIKRETVKFLVHSSCKIGLLTDRK